MKLTPKLLSYLNRVFDKEPKAFVALRVRYQGGLTWAVEEGVLSLSVTGGVGSSVTYALADYTLQTLAAAIAGRPGFEVAFLDAERLKLSALVLLDGVGDQDTSNGDRLLGYTSILWSLLEAAAVALRGLQDAMAALPDQLVTGSAEGAWLDELGSYYGVVRMAGEVDAIYGQRIIAETIRPVSNNVAMERAIEEFTGQSCAVLDVTVFRDVEPIYDGTIDYDGTYDFDAPGFPEYGLFDVQIAYDLIEGGDVDTFQNTVIAIVNRLRAAGTFLRSLALTSAAPITDTFPFAPTDTLGALTSVNTMADTMGGSSESATVWETQLNQMADTLSEPSEDVVGEVLAVLLDEFDQPILDENDEPILVPEGPLFD